MNKNNVRLANAFMLFLMGFNMLLVVVLQTWYWEHGQGTYLGDLLMSPLAMIPLQILMFIVPLQIFMKITGQGSLRASIPFRFRERRLGATNLVLIFGICFFLQPAVMLIAGIASMFVTNPATGVLGQTTSLPFFVGLLIVAVTPAICEEWIFRGYIQSRYSELPIRKAAFINGVFFGIIHLSLHQFPYAFIMGMVFAYMVYYTRSFFAGVWAHFLVNGMQFFLFYVSTLAPEPPPPTTDMDVITAVLIQLLMVAVVFLPGAIILYNVFVSYNRQRNIKWDLQAVLASPRIRPAEIEKKRPSPFDSVFWIIIMMYAVWMLLL